MALEIVSTIQFEENFQHLQTFFQSPTFVVSHFTLANIYTSKKDLEKAKLFYIVSRMFSQLVDNLFLFQSTLALQSTFEPALERLTAILCGQKYF